MCSAEHRIEGMIVTETQRAGDTIDFNAQRNPEAIESEGQGCCKKRKY